MGMILCLDLATYKTGIAVFESNGDLVESGTISVKQNDKTKNIQHRLSLYKKGISKVLKKYKPGVVVIEDTHGGNQNVAKMLNRLHGVILVEVYEHNDLIPIVYYTPNHLKKCVTNNGNASKQLVEKHVREYFENHFQLSINENADDNECDALGLGITYFKEKGIYK